MSIISPLSIFLFLSVILSLFKSLLVLAFSRIHTTTWSACKIFDCTKYAGYKFLKLWNLCMRNAVAKHFLQLLYPHSIRWFAHHIATALYCDSTMLRQHYIATALCCDSTILRQHYIATALCCDSTILRQHYVAIALYCDSTILRQHYVATALYCDTIFSQYSAFCARYCDKIRFVAI